MTNIAPEQIEELKNNFRGTVLINKDDGYKTARKVWNGIFDKHPVVVARCVCTSDDGDARVKDAYTEKVWNKLVEVKKEFDPSKLFQLNQNIKPSDTV